MKMHGHWHYLLGHTLRHEDGAKSTPFQLLLVIKRSKSIDDAKRPQMGGSTEPTTISNIEISSVHVVPFMNMRLKWFDEIAHPVQVDERWHVFNVANALNVAYWSKFFSMVAQLDFDSIVECGVGRGRSLITLLSLNLIQVNANGNWREPKHVFALDSFRGFPDPEDFEYSGRSPVAGEWSRSPSGRYEYTPTFLEDVLENAGLGSQMQNLTIVSGFFEETCKNVDVGRIGLLHLDADLYSSTKVPLESFASSVVSGGVIIVDDFFIEDDPHSDAFPGCRRAVMEFLEERNDYSICTSIRGTPYLVRG